MNPKAANILHWSPRILAIVFITFLALFALDVFDAGLGFWDTAVGLFMHLLPNFALLIVLLIAWRHELGGGILFLILGIVFAFVFGRTLGNFFIVAGPIFIIGLLFLNNWYYKRSILNHN